MDHIDFRLLLSWIYYIESPDTEMSIRNGNLKGQEKFHQAALGRRYNTGLLQTATKSRQWHLYNNLCLTKNRFVIISSYS